MPLSDVRRDYVDPVSSPLTSRSNRSHTVSTPMISSAISSVATSYDVTTLPNTKAEACLWSGRSRLTVAQYSSDRHKKGRLSEHMLVQNTMDDNHSSNLYNMVLTLMMIQYPYSAELSFYRIDGTKKEITLDNRSRIPEFTKLYNINQCLYEHTSALWTHYSNGGLPYYHLYQVLAKGSDLEGEAKVQWQTQLTSATLSLVSDDIVNKILQSQTVQFYQMRNIMELIMDLIVYRVLLFRKLKTKQSVRSELENKVLVSPHPGVHYDGIMTLVLQAIHLSKVFIDDTTAVQDLVNTLVNNVSKTSNQHIQLAIDLRSKLKTLITQKRLEHRERLQAMDQHDVTLLVFSWIEQFARELQNEVRLSIPSANTSMIQPAYKTSAAPVYKQSSNSGSSSSYRTRPQSGGLPFQLHPSSPQRYKPTTGSIHSLQYRDSRDDEEHLGEDMYDHHHYDKSRITPIDEWPNVIAQLEELHVYARNNDMSELMNQDDYGVLPSHSAEFPSKLDGKKTIHVRMFQLSQFAAKEGECHLIDSKCTVEPPYQGKCSLCGRNNHDSDHCRLRAQGKGPNGEPLVNLANLVWFPDPVLDEQLGYARKDGFLKGATEAEMKWVRKTIEDLKGQRKLLMKENSDRYQRPRSPGIYGPASSSSL